MVTGRRGGAREYAVSAALSAASLPGTAEYPGHHTNLRAMTRPTSRTGAVLFVVSWSTLRIAAWLSKKMVSLLSPRARAYYVMVLTSAKQLS